MARSITNQLEKSVPGCNVVLSTNTDHGHDLAQKLFDPDSVFYAPLDFLPSVRKALSAVNPEVMVFLETELWPTWISEAQRKGIRIALVHGRISGRSIGKYLAFRSLFREVLQHINAFSMITEEDARRIVAMGADPGRVTVNGNAKHDLLASQADPVIEPRMRNLLGLKPSHPVFIGGSTREGEEEILLSVYKRLLKHFPETVLLIAPRHVVRVPRIETMLRQQGLAVQLWTDLVRPGAERTAPVVLINTFGELFNLYSVGTILFCGASLVPLGGQNPLEPAAWGNMVFYGPSMEDFPDARELLEKNSAAVEVADEKELTDRMLYYLTHPDAAEAIGQRARQVSLSCGGAAERHAEVIMSLL